VLAAARGVEPGSAVNTAATPHHGQPLHPLVATLRERTASRTPLHTRSHVPALG
jgi:hypothetical protein